MMAVELKVLTWGECLFNEECETIERRGAQWNEETTRIARVETITFSIGGVAGSSSRMDTLTVFSSRIDSILLTLLTISYLRKVA